MVTLLDSIQSEKPSWLLWKFSKNYTFLESEMPWLVWRWWLTHSTIQQLALTPFPSKLIHKNKTPITWKSGSSFLIREAVFNNSVHLYYFEPWLWFLLVLVVQRSVVEKSIGCLLPRKHPVILQLKINQTFYGSKLLGFCQIYNPGK